MVQGFREENMSRSSMELVEVKNITRTVRDGQVLKLWEYISERLILQI